MGTVRGSRRPASGFRPQTSGRIRTKGARARRTWARRGAAAVLATAAVLASPAAYAGPGRAPAEVKPAFTSVNYAVAVDESASLSDADMAAEKAAAKRIALGDVSASSRVTVFGFAAAEAEGQSAVDPVCPRTTLDAAGRRTIGDCVGKLRKRTEKEGTGTDFPSAIRQGVHELTTGTDPSVPRVLFLLTDGVMDVSGSAKYGDESHRKEEGERQLTAALESAAANDVQIWPLGFGSAPDKAQLDRIAAGGYQKGCVDLPSARPTADVVTSGAKDLGPKLEKVFAAAHCLRYQPGPEGRRPPATLEIAISPLATVGSIVVDKGDAEVDITYVDPSGKPVPTTGKARGSAFELAGAEDTVEALRITDPLPGVWKVKAEAPEGHRSLPVGVSVLWQGELRGAITMDPPSPQAGQKATVTMRLQTRDNYAVKDPRDYAGLKVTSSLTGDGFAPVPLTLTDDGKGPDPDAGDASFTGTVRIPGSAAGALEVTGTLTASGLSADTRSEPGRVAPAELPVTAALTLGDADVHPGARITGDLAVNNTDGRPHTLRLSMADVRAGHLVVSPAEIVVEPGDSGTRKVTVEVAPADVFGNRLGDDGLRLGGTVTVVDTGTEGGDLTLVQEPLSVRVTPEPGLWEKYWWGFLTAAALLAAAVVAAVLLLGQRRRRRDPAGLVLRLVSETGEVVAEHRAGHGHKQWYEFAVVEPHRNPRIERRSNGPYAVQRSPEGGAVLRKRGGGRTRLTEHGQVELTDNLSLALAGPGPHAQGGPRPTTASAAPDGGTQGGGSYDAYL
ncbi:vWA domain-containing protein [Streptomyces zhihengii]|uniref:vWA domain-containing protein n=1 Tax=Streptomyces zhihengii TaxID=1818004 RepID=UPI001FD29525|nr:vWA domain-containing protein [Streptomyces zhihengii]